jgi:transcriptional regulator with XRE-family HTH domain
MNDRVQRLEASTDFAEEMLVAEIQSVLEELLEQKGYSRTDLAKRMGVTKARVTQIFSDTQNFTVRLIARAFHALGEKVVIDHEPLGNRENALTARCLKRDSPALGSTQRKSADDPSYGLAHYLGGSPSNMPDEGWTAADWRPYKGGLLIAGWPESEDLGDALASFIQTQIKDPPRSVRGEAKGDAPKAVAEWVKPSSNILPFRRERARA